VHVVTSFVQKVNTEKTAIWIVLKLVEINVTLCLGNAGNVFRDLLVLSAMKAARTGHMVRVALMYVQQDVLKIYVTMLQALALPAKKTFVADYVTS
jgi:hypothetical protein